MARRPSMKWVWRRILWVALIWLALCGAAPAEEPNSLILVTDKASGITSLTSSELRRLFLGLPVRKNDRPLVPLIIQCDPVLYQVFLQKVVFMSSQSYERHLLDSVIQLGGQRPKIHYQQDALNSDLHHHPGTVIFIWNFKLLIYPS